LIPQDVQTNGTVGVDVGMVDLGGKADLGWLEGIIGGKAYREEEDAARVGGITLGIRSLEKIIHHKKKRRTGPMIVACHWNMLSPVGPALHDEGGSRPRSINS
jgi:hypothetical protein